MFNAITSINCLSTMVFSLVLLWAPTAFAQENDVAQKNADEQLERLSGQLQEALAKDDDAKVVALLSKLIELRPEVSRLYYLRAVSNFNTGKFRQSVDDFDQLIKLQPDRSDSLWERGISCYFAGDYDAGAKQFLDYQNYHDQDVENSVWRYLCLAKSKGVQTARETLIPIERDPRPGLQEALELYRGKVTPEKLLEDMEKSDLTGQAKAGYRFYTLLYVGLYYDAEGKDDLAIRYLALAADPKLFEAGQQRISGYMWRTAKIAHDVIVERQAKKPEPQK